MIVKRTMASRKQPRIARRLSRAARFSVMVLVVVFYGFLMQGCMNMTTREYRPLTISLDGKSELHISTYPADFPRKTSSVPFLYKELRSPDAVYFQVFVRAVDKKRGPNPHVETIQIRSFSIQQSGQDPVRLIADHDDHFWMQGNPKDAPEEPAPVPYIENGFLQVSIDLTLNGQDYRFEEIMEAHESKSSMPLLLSALQ